MASATSCVSRGPSTRKEECGTNTKKEECCTKVQTQEKNNNVALNTRKKKEHGMKCKNTGPNTTERVSNLMFYTQLTSTVTSGRSTGRTWDSTQQEEHGIQHNRKTMGQTKQEEQGTKHKKKGSTWDQTQQKTGRMWDQMQECVTKHNVGANAKTKEEHESKVVKAKMCSINVSAREYFFIVSLIPDSKLRSPCHSLSKLQQKEPY